MKRLLIIVSFAALFLLPTGCQKFLDTVPDNRIEIDDVEKVRRVLANAYPRKTYAAFLEARCDDMSSWGTTFQGNRQTESFEFMRAGFYWMPYVNGHNDDSPEYFWEDQYRAISYCNVALDAIEKYGHEWPQADVKLLRAEAKVSRAYHHFTLLTLFSNMFQRGREAQNPGIPYVKEVEDQVFKQYKRRTVEETLLDIEEDLFSEINNLGTAANYDVPKFRFTREAAIAFAVRYCLFTERFDLAESYANMLIDPVGQGDYVITDDDEFGGGKKKYVSQDATAFKKMSTTLLDMNEYAKSRTDFYQGGLYFSNPEHPSYLLVSEVETMAWRANLGTLLTSYAYGQDVLSNLVTTNVTGSSFAMPILQLSNDPTAFVVKFYEDMLLVNESAGIGYVYNKIILLRLEEVLLARAEAKLFKSEPDIQGAIDDLNLYITRKVSKYDYEEDRLDKEKIAEFYSKQTVSNENFVNHSLNTRMFEDRFSGDNLEIAQAVINCILDFRRYEFLYEGMRWFDILRWNVIISHTRQTDNVTRSLHPEDDNRVLQIPETAQLSGLELNPMDNITEPWSNISYKY